ncbi:SCP2 sterol-binding domain-containing protein [Gammaproteobacteria bacterium AS21]
MLFTAGLLILESSVNKLISTDEVSVAALAKLNGKVFEFIVTDTSIRLFILPHNQGLQIQRHFDGEADTCLSGNLSQFQQLLSSDDKSSQLFGNGVKITGDSQLATKLQRIIGQLEIDYQGMLAKITGELAAQQLSNLFTGVNRQLNLTKHSLQLNTIEYLQEEIRSLPAPAEAEGFIEDVAQLTQDSERLAAKMEQLVQRLQQES